jgi:hypothetical protein
MKQVSKSAVYRWYSNPSNNASTQFQTTKDFLQSCSSIEGTLVVLHEEQNPKVHQEEKAKDKIHTQLYYY